jgi:8-oxo-dGTP pyrophosphatase MutT (NUDIX family)
MPVAVHVLLVRDGRILLLRRANTGYEDGNYSVVAGHVEAGEQIVETAVREAREEAGIEIAPEDLRIVGIMHRRADDERIDFFAVAARWSGEPRSAEPDKCDELRWFAIDALPANVIAYVRCAIEHEAAGTDAPWFESYGWATGER